MPHRHDPQPAAGFTGYRSTLASFLELFDRLDREGVVPGALTTGRGPAGLTPVPGDVADARRQAASRASRRSLAASPPAYPVSAPEDATTRWHGSTTHSGLAPSAAPTARDALGRPTRRASAPYVVRSP